MPDVGRTTEPRTVAGVGTTAASAAFTAPVGAFDQGDVGRTIGGANFGAGKTIATVLANGAGGTIAGGTAGVATGTAAASVGPDVGNAGFRGWSPETGAEAGVLTVASKNAGVTDHNRPTKDTPLNLRRSR